MKSIFDQTRRSLQLLAVTSLIPIVLGQAARSEVIPATDFGSFRDQNSHPGTIELEDGFFESFVIVNAFPSIGSYGSEDRAIIEFDVGSLGGPVLSASLDLVLTANSGDPASTLEYSVYPFAGNGIVDFSDAGDWSAGTYAGSFTIAGEPVGTVISIDVTAAVNQRISDGDQFAGFNLRFVGAEPALDRYTWLSGFNDGQNKPTLNVTQGPSNSPPVAVAGDDQSVRVGETVQLDGGGSFDDNTAPELLGFDWQLEVPAGSTAALDDPTAAAPVFEIDVAGTYRAVLIVTDSEGLQSVADDVTISVDNLAPTAVVSSAYTLAVIGQEFVVDGTASYDPEGDPISYFWTISSPAGSASELDDPRAASPAFVPDVEGVYQVTLITSDFIGPGDPVSLDIVCLAPDDYAEVVIVDAADMVDALGTDQITNQGNAKALNNFLTAAIESLGSGDVDKAIATLERAIDRVDGCALRGAPDGNGKGRDWVTDCAEQAEIYESLTSALELLEQ